MPNRMELVIVFVVCLFTGGALAALAADAPPVRANVDPMVYLEIPAPTPPAFTEPPWPAP